MTNSDRKHLDEEIAKIDKWLVEKIKEYYYFIVLSSFSLVLASFSKTEIPNAYIYAVSASCLFLFSFLMEIFKEFSNIAASISLLSSISGFVYFLFIIYEFAKVSDTVPKIFILMQYFIFIIIMASLMLVYLSPIPVCLRFLKLYWNENKKSLSMSALFISICGIIILSVSLCVIILCLIDIFFIFNIKTIINYPIIVKLKDTIIIPEFLTYFTSIIVFIVILELLALRIVTKESYFEISKKIESELVNQKK